MTTDKAFSLVLKRWKIIVLWFIAFALYWFANEYADTVLWVWVFALVGAYWVSARILTDEWKLTTSKVIVSVIIGLLCIWSWRNAYQEHVLKPSYAILSDTANVIQGTGYMLKVELENTHSITLNEEVFILSGTTIFEKQLELTGIETSVSIAVWNDYYTTGTTIVLRREPTADENKNDLIAEWLSGNIELNKKIFYLNSIAESIGIHKYEDTYWIGNEKTLDDMTKSVDLKKEWTDQYFEKLMKDNAIDLTYATMMRSDIIGKGVLENREYPCFHNNDVYNAYLTASEYKKRLGGVRKAQDKEKKFVLKSIENNSLFQCSTDY